MTDKQRIERIEQGIRELTRVLLGGVEPRAVLKPLGNPKFLGGDPAAETPEDRGLGLTALAEILEGSADE